MVAAPGLVPVLLVLGAYLRSGLRSYPSFDGAMNLNVARSLAEGHGYGFHYDSVFAFPAQTDGPFVLPAALLFRLFGIGLVTAQLVSLAYLAAFALLVMAVLRRLGAAPWLVGVGSLACLLTPGVGDFGLGGYGEIPMLAWLLAGFLAAGRGRHGLAGLLFGTAVLTKTVAALCVVPTLLVCAAFIVGTAPRRHRSRALAALAAGLLAPLLGWELFRLACLGSQAAWTRWWALQLGQIGRQSGAAELAGPAAALARLRLHLALLSGEVGVPIAPLAGWLVAPWLLALRRLVGRRRVTGEPALLLALLLLCPLLYAAWWLLVTPTDMAWLRRILPGLLLQTCLVAALAALPPIGTMGPSPTVRPRQAPGARLGMRRAGDPMRLPRLTWAHGQEAASAHPVLERAPTLSVLLLVLLALPGEALMLRFGVAVSPRWPSTEARRETDLIVRALRALPPDAVVFGVGWWQAPLFALLSDRSFMNLDLWDPARIGALPHAYLAVDQAASDLGGIDLLQVAREATLAPLVRGRDMALYRIVAIDPDRALRDPAPLTAGFDGRAVAQTSGWYLPDGGWAWVSPRSRITLGRGGQTRLVIEAAFWDELFRHGPQHLRIEAAGCLDQDVTVPSSGSRRIVLPLLCPPSPVLLPMTVTLSFDGIMPRPHQLDADTRSLAFQVHRLMLAP